MADTSRAIIQLYRDETQAIQQIQLTRGRTKTLRLMAGRPVTVLELDGASSFRPGGAVLMPGAKGGERSPLPGIAAALEHARGAAEERLLVAAHAEDEALTRERARSGLLFARGDREGWAAHAAERGRVEDWQQVLAWVASLTGWTCDPGPADGKAGPNTAAALAVFRKRSSQESGQPTPSGAVSAADWAAFYDQYDDVLAKIAGEARAALAERRQAMPVLETPAVGCGAAWPPDRVRIRAHTTAAADRVDLLFFAEKDLPALACHAGDACAPKKCDVYRKEKYRAVQPEPPVAAEQPAVVRALLKGLHFETDKAFLLPSAMKGIRQLKRFLGARPGLSLLVVGHADTAGKADHNLRLSDERARAMLQYLKDDVDAWLGYFEAPKASFAWGRREEQLMLSALPGGGAPSFFTGPPSGQVDARHATATKAFQVSSNATRGTALAEDGDLGSRTRRELVSAYMALDGQTLPAETVTALHGCGEFHPEEVTADGVASEANRRAEIFLFRSGIEPAPQRTCPAPGCAEYPQWRERTELTIDLSLEPADVSFVITNAARTALLEDAEVSLSGLEVRSDRTAASGLVRFAELIPGTYQVTASKGGFTPTRLQVDVQSSGAVKAKAQPAPPAARLAFAVTGAAANDLVAEGDAPTQAGFPTPIALTLERPTLAGRAGKDPKAPFGPTVVFAQGEEITLRWSVTTPLEAVDAVFIEGAVEQLVFPRDGQSAAGATSGQVTFTFADRPAAADGTWKATVVRGGERSAAASVEGFGITLLEVVSHPDDPGVVLDRGRRPKEPLAGRALPAKGLDPKGDEMALVVLKRDRDGRLIEPGHAVRFRWTACFPPGKAEVVLEILRNSPRQFRDPERPTPLVTRDTPEASCIFDVTADASSDPSAPATFDVSEDTAFTFDVVVRLLEPGSGPLTADELPKRKRLAASVLRVAKGFPIPKIAELELSHGGSSFRPGQVAVLGREVRPVVTWRIADHEPRNGLEVVVVRGVHTASRGKEVVLTEPIRPVRAAGQVVPAADKDPSGKREMVTPLPREEGDFTLFLRLLNVNGVVDEQAIAVRVQVVLQSLDLRLVQAGTSQGIFNVRLVGTPVKGGKAQEVFTDRNGVAKFTIELPMRVSCPLPPDGVGLTAATAWSPTKRSAPEPPGERTVARYVQLVRRVELAHSTFDTRAVVGALRKLAGYDNAQFQALYGLPPQQALEEVKADWGTAPPEAQQFAVQCKEHRIVAGDTFESVARKHGLTPASLARFNWNTDDEDRIDRCLGALVGCRSVDAKGRYVLHEGDAPGILHVPVAFEAQIDKPGNLELHPCTPGWKTLLSQAEVTELEWRHSRHSTDAEIQDAEQKEHAFLHPTTEPNGPGHPVPAEGWRETGIAADRGRTLVSMGHVMTGIAGGLNREESCPLAVRLLNQKGSQFIPGVDLAVWAALPNVDNLYTATIAGDLGQEAVLHVRDFPKEAVRTTVPYIGLGTEATEAEVVGDIDGFLLGWMLSTGKQAWLDPVKRRFPEAMRTSELLERFYGDRAGMKLEAGNSGKRYQLFRDGTICPAAKLKEETISFARLYKLQKLGSRLTEQVTPDAERSADAFQVWLKAAKDKP